MTNRKLVTPGALMMFAGAFLLYYGLRQFGIVGGAPVASSGNQPTVAPSTQTVPSSPRMA